MKNPELQEHRAELMREAEGLRVGGSFSDPTRFDTLLAEVEGIDAVERGDASHEQRSRALDYLASRSDAGAPNQQPSGAITFGAHRGEAAVPGVVAHMAEALAARCGGPKPSEAAAPYRAMRMTDLMRELLELRGVSARRMSPFEVYSRSVGHTTSDFPALLSETGNRVLRAGFEAATGGVTRIAKQTSAADFRPIQKLNLSEAPALLKVVEHGEITRGTATESKASYTLQTFARIFTLTRNAIVNDDLQAFGDFARKQGRAAAELISSELAALLTSNPVLADGVALFHATHKNLGTAGVISIASLGEALKKLRLQVGLDGKTPINAQPKYLVVPAALEVLAKQNVALINSTKTADVNPFAANLEVVVDPRLDAASATAWYLAADQDQIDTIEYAFLDEAPGPQFAVRDGFDVLGAEMRVVLDVGFGVIDFRGLVKNAGA